MAMSPAMQWALANGMSQADVYKNINDFLATNPTVAQTQAQMSQYGISPEDVAAATGGKSGGLLGGNILAGASWNSLNTTLGNQLTAATGKPSTNIAVGGATTADTLSQLNKFLAGGGQFDSNSTVYLQTGGVDFITGIDKNVVKSNISQIVKTLGSLGVNVVLTGSPYAKSLDDVINNNFDPKVDQIFTDIANENKNVALVGIQGEILKNKSLLVDALHTNAEGTAIYNQAVIDSLSQFKNNVPSSTPQAIAQVQQTNTVATTPPIITQASVSPVVAQSLAKAIPTTRGTVIEGDDIEAQIAGVPQVVYETRVDPNNTANWETFNPKTGEVIDRGTFAGGGDKGLLAAAAPVIGLAASTVGLPFITSLLGGATGLTGSALAGATGATIGAGTQAITGGSAEDIARAALIGGGGAYLGNQLSNYLDTGTTDIGITERQFAIQDAKQLANQGLTTSQIRDTLSSGGYNDAIVDRAITAITTTPAVVTTPVTDTSAVNVTAPSNVSLNNVLNTIASTTPAVTTPAVTTPVVTTPAVTTPVTDSGTVNVTGSNTSLNNVLNTIASTIPAVTVTAPKTTQTVDQATLDLIASQLASNVTTPANLNNLANVTVTGEKPITTPVTTQDVITAIGATLPALTTGTTLPTSTVPTTTITAPKAVTTQDIVNSIIATTPATVTSTIPTTTITAQKPSTITDDVTAATIPLIQPTTPLTVPEVTTKQDLTTAEQLRLAQLALTAAGLLGAGNALTNTDTGTQFPIIPVPADWKSPPATGVAPFTPLPPIDFGTRELLRGTQWEKFLSPTYGKVPEPVMYSQPSNMSYSDLMGILGSKQGMPAKSSLSINDIISGIQNQYGQTPTRTMG
jgi:hypothetical protein